MDRKLLLVVNPIAGQRRANRSLAEIVRVFNEAEYRCEIYVTGASGDATNYIAAHAEQFDRVVCIGGDGTLNEAVTGVLRSGESRVIGYIPAGSTNDFAASLNLSMDVVQAARDASGLGMMDLDIGTFNERPFIYTAACGAFARVSYSVPQSAKNSLGHLAYVLEGIRDISSLRPFHLSVTTEDRELDGDFLFCSVTNSTSVGGVLKLDTERVLFNDGRFEVLLVRNPKNPRELSDILWALSSMEVPTDLVEFFHAGHITVDADQPLEWSLDGEKQSAVTHADMHNLHEAIRLAVPAETP